MITIKDKIFGPSRVRYRGAPLYNYVVVINYMHTVIVSCTYTYFILNTLIMLSGQVSVSPTHIDCNTYTVWLSCAQCAQIFA